MSRRSSLRRSGGIRQADSPPPALASGNKLEWKDGRPVYTPGQLALCCALVQIKEHPLNRDKKHFILQVVEALDLMNEQSLFCLADMIEEMSEDGRLKHQPLMSELRRMAVSAIDSCRELNGELALYGLWKHTPEQQPKAQAPSVRHAAEAEARTLSVKRNAEAETEAGSVKHAAEVGERIILRRPGSPASENIIDPSLLGARCAVRLDGRWQLGEVVHLHSAINIEVRLDNGRYISGDPHDADFTRLD
jgi:hypothetical protein